LNIGELLPELDYEISVLSSLQSILDPFNIILGKHGVLLWQGEKSGIFLPQVAEEADWTLETFLNQLCTQEAGLDLDCWREKDTEIYVFTAEVFGEDTSFYFLEKCYNREAESNLNISKL